MGRNIALLMGNGAFAEGSGFTRLRCAAKDAEDLYRVLSDDRHGGFEATCLQDKPQRTMMKAISEALQSAAGQDDLVLLYYSGHGKPDEDGNLYLAASDSEARGLAISGVAVDFIGRCMQKSKAEKIALILDCCYSGAVERFFTKGEVADQISTALPKKLSGHGTYVLTASTSTQLAEEKESDENSLLTKHILSGIADGLADTDDDGIVTMHELLMHVQASVKREGSQEPTGYALRMGGGELPIAMTGKARFEARKMAVEAAIYSARTEHHIPASVRDGALLLVARADVEDGAKASLDKLYEVRGDAQRFIDLLYTLTAAERATVAPPPAGEAVPARGAARARRTPAKPSLLAGVPLITMEGGVQGAAKPAEGSGGADGKLASFERSVVAPGEGRLVGKGVEVGPPPLVAAESGEASVFPSDKVTSGLKVFGKWIAIVAVAVAVLFVLLVLVFGTFGAGSTRGMVVGVFLLGGYLALVVTGIRKYRR